MTDGEDKLVPPDSIWNEELYIVGNDKGDLDLKVRKAELKKPWRVGVTDKGDNVFAPISGPNAVKVLHLKREVGVCKHCRCTVHRRNAVVDPEGNVYCKPHWPHGPFKDPRDNSDKELPPSEFPQIEGKDE